MMNTTDYENIWKASLIHVTDEFSLPPVVLQAGEAIIGTLGNFSVSTGKAKAKKTFNVSAIVAAALVNGQVLEYQASFPESKRTILYFDTEQSPYHCQLVMQRILRLAKLPIDKEPQNLKFSHLRAIADPNERRKIIRYAIYNTPNVGLVVIDGIRDLMLDINNSTEATKLVGDLMQWTSEQNIHIQTVLHLNKGDDNARGHIGTELNNKAETVLQITKDSTLPERSIVAPAIIRSKPFNKFAFRLKEMEDEVCIPEIDLSYSDNERKPHRFSYQELSTNEHRKALAQAFASSKVLPYGGLIVALKKVYAEVVGQSYGQTKLKELLQFLLNKDILIKEERGKYRLNRDNQP
ncbi:mobilization protein [Prevotella intermedia]|uniref:Mobilization protein n=1 Tax=Prevotella intermedia TaxID=28131 RepID=A0A246ES35_PREIN|nr:AAA family ATPase [Prevotella intermedia]ATV29790.1 mobilization protein [Prevotella intermedia]OWP31710.1 mobilization protein [Prevotella intermedia]PJI24332.1 mobilization protein [Prevotella intermedia]